MRPARVQLLVTCLVDRFFPGTGESVVRVLERAGVAVTVPASQTCCGQPAFNAGYDPEGITTGSSLALSTSIVCRARARASGS